MNKKFSLIRPSLQAFEGYEASLSSLIELCASCPPILALIRHGSFPGDLGISDIDVIVVVDENQHLDLSVINQVKTLSYLLDVMFIPCSFISDLPYNLSLSNPFVLYSSISSYDLVQLVSKAQISSYDILFSESISAYLHKYACLIRFTSSNTFDLRRILLCAKSVLRSIDFIKVDLHYIDSFETCRRIHAQLRSSLNAF